MTTLFFVVYIYVAIGMLRGMAGEPRPLEAPGVLHDVPITEEVQDKNGK